MFKVYPKINAKYVRLALHALNLYKTNAKTNSKYVKSTLKFNAKNIKSTPKFNGKYERSALNTTQNT